MAVSLPTLHPCKQPAVQVRIIEYRICSTVAQRLAQFPCSHTSDPADPSQVHREGPTFLDPQQAPADELILCYHDGFESEACIDEQKTHLRLWEQPLQSRGPQLGTTGPRRVALGALHGALLNTPIGSPSRSGP